MALLVTPWSPSEMYGILQRNRELKMRQEQQAQVAAANIAANFVKQKNFREKMDFDREQAIRSEEYRNRYLDVMAGKNTVVAGNPLAIPGAPIGGTELPSNEPETSLTNLPAGPEGEEMVTAPPMVRGSEIGDPRADALRRHENLQVAPRLSPGQLPGSATPVKAPSDIGMPIAENGESPLPEGSLGLPSPGAFKPAGKGASKTVAEVGFPLSPEAVSRINFYAPPERGGQKAMNKQMEIETQQAAMRDTAAAKEKIRMPGDGDLFDTLDAAVAKSDELNTSGRNSVPVLDARTKKYGLKFFSKDEDETARREAKTRFDMADRSLRENDRRVSDVNKRLDALAVKHPVIANTTGIFTAPDGKRRFGQADTRAENSELVTPESETALTDYRGLRQELGLLTQSGNELREARTRFDDMAKNGFRSQTFRDSMAKTFDPTDNGGSKKMSQQDAQAWVLKTTPNYAQLPPAEKADALNKARAAAEAAGLQWWQ